MKLFTLVLLVVALSACATRYEGPGAAHKLAVSQGVKQIFEDNPDLESVESGATADGDVVICRLQRRLGSHLGTRVCMTRNEWRQREADSNRIMREDMALRRGCVAAGGRGGGSGGLDLCGSSPISRGGQ